MNKTALALAITLAVSPAYAGGKPKPMPIDVDVKQRQSQHQGQHQGQRQVSKNYNDNYNLNKNINKHESTSESFSDSTSEAMSESFSNSSAMSVSEGSAANNEGVSQQLHFSENHPDDIKIENVPNIGLGGVFPAGICMKPIEGALSIQGLGLGGGGVFIDENCMKLEWIRMAYTVGLRNAAVFSLCSMEQAEGNPHCKGEQDYTKELMLLKTDNENFVRQFEEMSEENQRLRDEVAATRLQKATSK